MKLRTRLLSAFVASSFLLVMLCGILAYRIAKNIMENHESTLTHNLATDMADLISPPSSGSSPNLEALQDAYYPLRFWGQLVIIEGKEGILYTLPTHSDLLQLAMENPLKTALPERVLKQGQFKNDGLEYLWATVPIKNTAYMLTVIRPLQEDKDGTFKAIITRLIVTSIIIFWLSAWGALIVSSWIAARLNKQNEAILYQALHDSLTGLPNRTSLFRELGAAIENRKNQNRFIAVYVLDLDRFKEINDTIGHGWGDELLKQMAGRLTAISNDGNTIARLGGDEFAILHVSEKREDILTFLNEIARKMDEPFLLNEIDLHINA
ncbi:MAG: GGDEF domain-containing protein, partial [Nitrospirota bacterium]|nr:GGDEF domain-containing protein [Nitrospirota bacterium]